MYSQIVIWNIINKDSAMEIKTPKISEILLEEFMQPYGISDYRLAKDINVPVHDLPVSYYADTDIVSSALNLGPDASTEGVPMMT